MLISLDVLFQVITSSSFLIAILPDKEKLIVILMFLPSRKTAIETWLTELQQSARFVFLDFLFVFLDFFLVGHCLL